MKDNKEVKKLCRMLDAAGIKYEDTGKLIMVTKDNNSFAFGYWEIKQRGARGKFEVIRKAISFKGNDWDGLQNRLEESQDWKVQAEKQTLENGKHLISAGKTFSHRYSEELIELGSDGVKLRYMIGRSYFKIKPHKLWKFLDKVEACYQKGGKQTIHFNDFYFDFEFEFNFPVQ